MEGAMFERHFARYYEQNGIPHPNDYKRRRHLVLFFVQDPEDPDNGWFLACQNYPLDEASCTFDGNGLIQIEITSTAVHLVGFRIVGFLHVRNSAGEIIPSWRRPGDGGNDVFWSTYLFPGETKSATVDFRSRCKFGCEWRFNISSQTLNDVGGTASIRIFSN
jgi:hypothetical protein